MSALRSAWGAARSQSSLVLALCLMLCPVVSGQGSCGAAADGSAMMPLESAENSNVMSALEPGAHKSWNIVKSSGK